eukprot:SM000071S21041  [mRNA]  locus=s71:5779:8092:+ [translate_table: standard]
MWDTGTNVGELDGHSKRVLSCDVRPVRPLRVMTCGEDFLVNYYEGPPFRFKSSHREHRNFVNCLRYSPDGSKVLTVGSDKRGILFSGSTGEKLGELAEEGGHAGSIYAASWSPDGTQVLTVSADKTAKVWDVAADGSSAAVASTFTFDDKPGVEHMQVGCLWLGRHMVTVSLSGNINYLDAGSPSRPRRVITGHSKYITALALAPQGLPSKAVAGEEGGVDGLALFTAGADGTIVRWQAGVGPLGRVTGKGHGAAVVGMVATEDCLITCGLDDMVRWTAMPAEQFDEGAAVALGGQPTGLAVAAAHPNLVLCTTAAGLVLLQGGSVAARMAIGYAGTAVALSPDGTQAAVGGADGKIRVYGVAGDALVEETALERHRGQITTLRYSPDGLMLASGDQNRETVVWHVATRELKMRGMVYHTARVSAVAWSLDSARLATASLDTSILVYEVGRPASAHVTIKGAHAGGVTDIVFAGARRLVSVGDDACVRFWMLP